MAGMIRKRVGTEGKVSYQALLSWRDQGTGKTVQVSATRRTKKEAEQALVELATKYRGSRQLVHTDRTFAQLCDEYLKVMAADRQGTTMRNVVGGLSNHFLPPLGDRRVRDITTKDFDDIFAKLLTDGYMASTVTNLRSTIASPIMQQAVRWGWINLNPVKTCRPIRVPDSPVRVFTLNEVKRLLETADTHDPMFGVYCRLVAATGIRVGEACALQFKDIGWDDAKVSITKTVHPGAERHIRLATKTGKDRVVYLDVATLGRLAEWRDVLTKRMTELGAEFKDSMYLFSPDVAHLRPLDPSSAGNRFRAVRYKAKVTGTLRDLRHTVATMLLVGGIDVKSASDALGNSPAVLLKHYAGVTEEAKRRGATVMGSFLSDV